MIAGLPSFHVQTFDIENTKPSRQENVTSYKLQQIPVFPFIDISFGNPFDPQDICEYDPIIYHEMRKDECQICSNLKEFAPQEILPVDRACLIDWMCRLNFKCQLSTNTLFVATSIVDKIFRKISIPKKDLLLIGCASMLIASKSEDVVPISIEQIMILSENSFRKSDLAQTEPKVLEAIDYSLIFPTSYIFLNLFLRANEQSRETILFSKYVLELCLTSVDFLTIKPSAVAATAIAITRLIGGVIPWTAELQHYTQYTFTELIPYVRIVHAILLQENRVESQFMKRKYGSDPYLNIARVQIPPKLPYID
ncbi:Cyclin, N-terminal domain containing protein [Tritrichomonas foetus]|uniref:Cyclin, N-terminal domain containing protein n=1 Tax=Tritrichomonas foetus TaxID=1144522 RepID=A0A1J4JBB1_9EUKA|nr:Cyclin, N-terminal domain containing protein [Tritrichomonas foetus]|eukprot:OHS94717.1 Cyclin, N-terminal domain containing protein [Tritrichomonas foetus]